MKGEFLIEAGEAGKRLDVVFNEHFPQLTRSHIKKLIEEGTILLNNSQCKAGEKVREGDRVAYSYEENKPLSAEAEDIDFDIVYEDKDLIVVNKPQGLVVHPCASTKSGRLDKNTSGLMVVAKNDFAHLSLAKQIKDKTCKRNYIALCEGVFGKTEGKIETFIERSKSDRKKMAVSDKGKKAVTNYKVIKVYPNSKKSLVEFSLETGRTHQIRVHCKMMNHPIVGDDVYGKADKKLKGQLLHSYKITFVHPRTSQEMTFEVDLPDYFKDYIKDLK